MVSLTLSVPEDVRELMKKFPEFNWSAFVRKLIVERARKLAEWEKIKAQLDSEEEQEIIDWSVKLQRASRSGRLDSLKKKGLL